MAPTEDSIIATSPPPPPHFVLVPLVAAGHMIPMADLALLIAERGARVSLVTTPVNAPRLRGVVERARQARLPLEIVELSIPPAATAADDDVLLPPGCENIDQIEDNNHFLPLFQAIRLAGPLEAHPRAQPQGRRPSCIVSGWCNSWTAAVATRLGVPRLFFHGPSCFYSLCDINVAAAAGHGLIPEDESEAYVVPGMPVRVEVTKATGPGFLNSPGFEAFQDEAMEAMRTADGAVVNTFLGLEEQFVACYEAALGKPVWTLGPFCLVNSRDDAAQGAVSSRGHGKPSSVGQSAVTAWLDAMEPGSVVYAVR